MCEVTPQLVELARILADWAAPATGTIIYLYGSRVRGDYRPDSDVDISMEFLNPTEEDIYWWSENNDESFKAINGRLGNRLEILEHDDPLGHQIRTARIIHEDRNVRCVWLPPKTFSSAG
jgi:predicted nucleotidyltransferase